ncbi:hypothetical protein CF5_0007 [Staphylococcus phage CF5]|uniref:Uncharacterized protein n=1 Tax=Staphylococcus phage CF5 TaxID=3113739 RepID=A0AAX4J7J7_9CAUD|nr:hypothetical protein CF5_0007 [Staphylococcus phage CF5]
MKIKETKVVSFNELMELHANGDLPYVTYYGEDSIFKYRVDTDMYGTSIYKSYKNNELGEPRIHIPIFANFEIDNYTEITEDTVLDTVVCLAQYNDTKYTKTLTRVSINDCTDTYEESISILSISIIQDNELITIWKDGELL